MGGQVESLLSICRVAAYCFSSESQRWPPVACRRTALNPVLVVDRCGRVVLVCRLDSAVTGAERYTARVVLQCARAVWLPDADGHRALDSG
jgi:hypothetical protein